MRWLVYVAIASLVLGACAAAKDGAAPSPGSPLPTVSDAGIAAATTTTTAAPSPSSTAAVPSSTSSAVALQPPTLEVRAPAAEGRVTDRHYRFTGLTDPGCEVVAAGKYPVPVADDGSWETVLILNPGGNVASFTATDQRGSTTELSLAVYYDPPVELRGDGLGAVDFQTPMSEAMTNLTAMLGEPDDDQVYDRDTFPADTRDDEWAIFGATGYPGNDYARFVTWRDAGLQAMFSDRLDFGDGEQYVNFNGWIASDPGEFGAQIATGAGIGVGSTLAELEAAYGDDLTWYAEPDEITGGWHFSIDTDVPGLHEDDVRRFSGGFSGDPAQSGTTVSWLQAGFGFVSC